MTLPRTPKASASLSIDAGAGRRSRGWREHLLGSAGAALAVLASPANAQTTAGATPQVEEVIVTASKRETKLQETPMTISAFSGSQLRNAESSGISDLVRETPGLAVQSAGAGRETYAIRGISSDSGSSPTVGFYLDDVPITPPTDTGTVGRSFISPDLYDLSRVEVLQGPQGTLYGAASMGGTIRLITNQPRLNTFEGSAEAIGSYTAHAGPNGAADAMVNVPIGDKLAIRAVVSEKSYSGFIDDVIVNPFPATSETTRGNISAGPIRQTIKGDNTLQQEGGRISLLYRPTDRLDITASVFLQDLHQANPDTYDGGAPRALTHYAPYAISEPFGDKFQIYNGTLKYKFDGFDLYSSTSYLRRRTSQTEDITEELGALVSAYPFPQPTYVPSPVSQSHTVSQISNETRLSSNVPGRFTWVVGSFVLGYKNTYNAYMQLPAWGPYFGTGNLLTYESPQKQFSYALFGEGAYKITDHLSIVAGLRWFYFNQKFDLTSSGVFAPGAPFNNQHVTAHGSQVTPKVSLQYNVSSDNIIYATYARGARVGGPDFGLPTSGPASCLSSLTAIGFSSPPSEYGSDTVDSYELGAKTRTVGGRLTMNASVFDVEWGNIQQQVRLACGYSIVTNLGSARSRGIDFQFDARVTDHLTLDASVGYTDAHILTTIPGLVQSGSQIEGVPTWTSNQRLTYTWPLASGTDLIYTADNQYYGPSIDVLGPRGAYDLLKMRLSAIRGPYDVSLFVDNLTNVHAALENTLSQGANVPSLYRIATNRPRTVGLDLKYHF